MLRISDITLRLGPRVLFDNATVALPPNVTAKAQSKFLRIFGVTTQRNQNIGVDSIIGLLRDWVGKPM